MTDKANSRAKQPELKQLQIQPETRRMKAQAASGTARI